MLARCFPFHHDLCCNLAASPFPLLPTSFLLLEIRDVGGRSWLLDILRQGHPRECNLQLWNYPAGPFEWKTYSSNPCTGLDKGKECIFVDGFIIEGQYANDDATELVELASKRLQSEARDKGDLKFLPTAIAPLQK